MNTIKPHAPDPTAPPPPAAANFLQAGKPVAVAATPPPVVGATPVAADKAAPVDRAELKYSIEAINKFLKVNSEVEFSIDDASGKAVIKVIDTESKKILRQFPSEQALEIGKDLGKLKGFLINSEA